MAREALLLKGHVSSADVMFLAQALVEAHEKVDQLYKAIEDRSDATHTFIEQVLRDHARFSPSAAACRDLRSAIRAALDRGPVHAPVPDRDRLDWLSEDAQHLLDVYNWRSNSNVSTREAVDRLMASRDGSVEAQ
jgi:hypothetical protein